MIIGILYMIISFFVICIEHKNEKDASILWIENLPIEQNKQIDSVLFYISIDNGKYIKYKYLGYESYLIEWGTNEYSNLSLDTFYIQNNGYLNVYWSNDTFIELRQGCGVPCWYSVILPFVKNQRCVKYEYALAYNRELNLIAYTDSMQTITIENYQNKEKKYYKTDWCDAAFFYDCIDTAYFQKNKLHIKYIDIHNRQQESIFLFQQDSKHK